MSKIHEALKKAERERGQASQGSSAVVTAEVETVEMPAGASAAEAGPLNMETLQAGCARPAWHPGAMVTKLFDPQQYGASNEELRTLRSRLYRIRDQRPLRSLLVTSALPSEGKTFIVANLAQAIVQQHERKAIMIDADLRNPQLHTVFGAPGTPGLSEYLRGEADEMAIIQRGHRDNLFLIPAGKQEGNAAELISNGRLNVLLERLATVFDWILLDSPPTIPVADATIISKSCDGVLMVVQSAVTPYDLAQRARQQFPENSIVGAILNQVDPSMAHASYYSGYQGESAANKKKT
jgi:protein-tyrosine kinase